VTVPLSILQDVKIAAFTQFLLGPAAVQYLADMGADVVKVEPLAGGYERRWAGGGTWPQGVSAFFLLAHRNVRSLAVDLKTRDGLTIARRLASDADVLVENFRPGVMERLGLGYEELRTLKPDLIYATGSGYGSDSPFRDLPGQDLLLQAITGMAAVTGSAEQPPTAAGAAVVDQHAAALLAMGILGALHHRARTGEGQRVEVTMVQAGLDLQTEPFVYDQNGGTVRRPSEPLGSAFHEAPYGFYATSDGHVAVSVSPVKRVAEALGDPEELRGLDDPAAALERREAIHRALAPLLARGTTAEIVARLRAGGVWCAPVNDYSAALADPVVAHVDPAFELEHPEAGTVRLLKHPVRYGSGEFAVRRQPPRLGEHTETVLGELGFAAEDISAFRDAGAI
jgi:crotonobetainyl-CoA:carnitine CoA-transferase CaiB-like acyl-CoA transferase